MQSNESDHISLCEPLENISKDTLHIHSKVAFATVVGHAQWTTYQDLRKVVS